MLAVAKKNGKTDDGIVFCGQNHFSSKTKLPRYYTHFAAQTSIDGQRAAATKELSKPGANDALLVYCSREQSLAAGSVCF